MYELPVEFVRLNKATGKYELLKYDDHSRQYIVHDYYDSYDTACTILRGRAFGYSRHTGLNIDDD